MKTFKLLSIGQRGVGKTVFLAGSYAELHAYQQSENTQTLWFDCQEDQGQENIENILSYVSQTCHYPPPTMKVNDFCFSLKRRRVWGIKTLCHFHWCDVPGEICNVNNLAFQKQVISSHGCCVFINAKALVHDSNYLYALSDIFAQVSVITSLAAINRLKYAFALICTQCDQLEGSRTELQQIDERLQPLISHLSANGTHYRQFNSAIPIVLEKGSATLKPTGAAAPLLWLNLELMKIHKFRSQQSLVQNSLQSLSPVVLQASALQQLLSSSLRLTPRITLLVLVLLSTSIIGIIFALTFDRKELILSIESYGIENKIQRYERLLQQQPTNILTLVELSQLYIESGQSKKAISVLEKLIRQNPKDLNVRLKLAQLYENVNNNQQAETTYNQILSQENNNVPALLGKATLRSQQGDEETAKLLFVQAEKAVSQENKSQVRALAQMTLQSQAKSKISDK